MQAALCAFILFAAGTLGLSQSHSTSPSSSVQSTTTKLDAFLGTRGALVVRDIQMSGTINGPDNDFSIIGVAAIAAYEPGTEGTKTKGFQISIHRAKSRGLSETRTCTLDLEEGESLSKALQYLSDAAGKSTGQGIDKDGERQVYFVTKDAFRVGYSQTQSSLASSVTVGSIGAMSIEFKGPGVFASLKAAVDRGLEWLQKQ